MRSTAILLALVLSAHGSADVIEPDEHPLDYVWDLPDDEQVDLALELLRRGTDRERRWVASESDTLLMDLDSDEDDTWAIERMTRLREWTVREQDDFVVSLVLKGINDFEEEIAGALFLELLSHPSPNVRHQAVAYYADWGESPAAIPILESMWKTESREWIRDDLMIALASLGSTLFVDDFIAETESADPARADLSIDALGFLDDPRALTELIELATDRVHPLRIRALQELAYRSESPEVRDVLLAASHDPDDAVRGVVVSTLREFDDAPEVRARLLEIAGSGADADIRYAALNQLSADDPEVRKILEGIASGPRTPELESLVNYAARQLTPPEPQQIDPFMRELMERQRAGEQIDWESYGYEVETVTISCGFGYAVVPEGPDALLVRADAGRSTTRCWSAPGVAADFLVNPRIEGSSLVAIADHHEYRGELWVRLLGQAWGCWVPRERLEKVPKGWTPPPTPGSSLGGEFDLFSRDERFAATRILARHGTVEFFDRDEGSGVEAVAVDLRLTPPTIETLVESYRGSDGAIDRMLVALLGQVPENLDLEPELRTRIDELLSPERSDDEP